MGDSASSEYKPMKCFDDRSGGRGKDKAVDDAERRNTDDDSTRGSKGSKVDPKNSLFSISEDDEKDKKGKGKKKEKKGRFW